MGSNSTAVKPKNTRKLLGSADIDSDLNSAYPHDARWDYAIGYDHGVKKVHYVEVHPASGTHNAKEILAKLSWLKGWLATVSLDVFPRQFHWVCTGNVGIPRHNKILRALAVQGIRPRSPLVIG